MDFSVLRVEGAQVFVDFSNTNLTNRTNSHTTIKVGEIEAFGTGKQEHFNALHKGANTITYIYHFGYKKSLFVDFLYPK